MSEMRRREVRVVSPQARLIVVYKGHEYPVMSASDLKLKEMLALYDVEARENETLGETVERIKQQIQRVCPTVDGTVFEDMTYGELLEFMRAATDADEQEASTGGPQPAPAGSGESSTISPPPPAPSDGPTTS